MSVVPIHKEWVEVVLLFTTEAPNGRWFVNHCDRQGMFFGVDDCATEEQAMASAAEWGLPITRPVAPFHS